MKLISLFLLLLAAENSFAQGQNNAQVMELYIEGTQDTEMATFSKGNAVDAFNAKVKEITITNIKNQLKLDSIQFADNVPIKYKRALNRLAGFGKLSSQEKSVAKNYKYTIKVKCDIAFNETVGGFIIDETSSRAVVYVTIGLYDSEGKKKSVYKGKCKDSVVFLGKNARRAQWLGKEDFLLAYQSALEELKEK